MRETIFRQEHEQEREQEHEQEREQEREHEHEPRYGHGQPEGPDHGRAGQGLGHGHGPSQGPGQAVGPRSGPRQSDAGFELPLIVSAVLPARFRHGFTTRRGGVSAAPWDSLNLGDRAGEDPARVAENRRRVRAAAGGRRILFANQVHGARSALVDAATSPELVARLDADAVLTASARTAVGVNVLPFDLAVEVDGIFEVR